jgi:preprotein translocase subunit YajC
MTYLIPLILVFALMWLLLIRPQRRRTQAQLAMQDHLRKGDEIITAGGLHATVQSIEDEVLEVEIAPDTVVRLDRRAVAAVLSAEEPEPEEPEEPEQPALEPAKTEQPVSPDDG